MELRVLRYFLAVAREESITAAAEALHLTQPTLSKQLMDLEKELGKKLFIRGNRKVTLTEDGIFLRKRAQEIVALAQKTEADFAAADQTISGNIFIGGGETETMRLVARTAKNFHEDYPNVCFHLFSGNGEEVADGLDKGLIDFGLFVGRTNLIKYDYLKLPTADAWGLLLRSDNPLAEKTNITPKDMEGIPLLCSRQALIQNEMSGWLGVDFSSLNIVATYNLIYNAAIMVEEGMGAALCIDKLVNVAAGSSLCFRPLSPAITAEVVLAWKKHQTFSKGASKFLDYIQQEIR